MVVAGNAEHFAHHCNRVVIGEIGNELTPSLGREGVHESVGQVPHGHPVTVGGPRRERSCNQATKARVLSTILRKDGVGQKSNRLISSELCLRQEWQRGDETRVSEQRMHRVSAQHGHTEGRTRDRRSSAQLAEDRLGIGLHRRVERVQEGCRIEWRRADAAFRLLIGIDVM